MYLIANKTRYSNIVMTADMNSVKLTGAALVSLESLPNVITLYADNGFELKVIHPGLYSTREVRDGVWFFTNCPERSAEPELTPKEQREAAYETEEIIVYDGDILTVDEANKLYMSYLAEGNESRCTELQHLIYDAKTSIRNKYPDDKEV